MFTNSLSKCKSPQTQSLCPKPITTNYNSSAGFGRLSEFCHGQRVITSELQMSLPPQRFKQIRFSLATRNQAVLLHRRSITSGHPYWSNKFATNHFTNAWRGAIEASGNAPIQTRYAPVETEPRCLACWSVLTGSDLPTICGVGWPAFRSPLCPLKLGEFNSN